MSIQLLELKNDLVFQKIFGTQKNSLITRHLLSLILNREISDVNLDANKRMLKDNQDSKTCRLDVRVKFNNGEDCNIELQVAPYAYMAERMLEYWSGMYDMKIHSGDDYSVLKPSISILIANFKLEQLKYIPNYHTIWNLREKFYSSTILTDNIEMHILEIPKIENYEILKNDELAQWLKFIENPENKEVEKLMRENRFLRQAKKELSYLSGDPDFQRLVDARAGFLKDMYNMKKQALIDGRAEGIAQGLAEGRAKGKADGLAEGKAEEKIEIAKKMKLKNMPINEIMELTGLSKMDIDSL